MSIHPMTPLMPAPVLRLWFYLKIHGPYTGTPGGLWEDMRRSGVRISRRAVSDGITFLSKGGMAVVSRRGHHVDVRLAGETA